MLMGRKMNKLGVEKCVPGEGALVYRALGTEPDFLFNP